MSKRGDGMSGGGGGGTVKVDTYAQKLENWAKENGLKEFPYEDGSGTYYGIEVPIKNMFGDIEQHTVQVPTFEDPAKYIQKVSPHTLTDIAEIYGYDSDYGRALVDILQRVQILEYISEIRAGTVTPDFIRGKIKNFPIFNYEKQMAGPADEGLYSKARVIMGLSSRYPDYINYARTHDLNTLTIRGNFSDFVRKVRNYVRETTSNTYGSKSAIELGRERIADQLKTEPVYEYDIYNHYGR